MLCDSNITHVWTNHTSHTHVYTSRVYLFWKPRWRATVTKTYFRGNPSSSSARTLHVLTKYGCRTSQSHKKKKIRWQLRRRLCNPKSHTHYVDFNFKHGSAGVTELINRCGVIVTGSLQNPIHLHPYCIICVIYIYCYPNETKLKNNND